MAKRLSPGARNRPPPIENRLLAALPPADYKRIFALLEVVSPKLKTVLHKPGEPIRHVYFPGTGFCSILTVLQDGNMVEVATIGNEGMIGTSLALDGSAPFSSSMVQGEGASYRMTAAAFLEEMNRRGVFSVLLMRFAQAFVGVVMVSTACNAVHSIEQRLARWLLMARDRMHDDEFPLTQEFVAMMLGATRPTVTVVAGTLQRAGLITYHRGHVTILDGGKLEAASCECYRAATNMLSNVTAGVRN